MESLNSKTLQPSTGRSLRFLAETFFKSFGDDYLVIHADTPVQLKEDRYAKILDGNFKGLYIDSDKAKLKTQSNQPMLPWLEILGEVGSEV